MDSYVLITGASSGIGYHLVKVFASKGHNLVLAARRKAELEKLSDSLIKKYNINAITLSCDLMCHKETQKLCSKLKDNRLKVSVLINNAGIGDFNLFSESEYNKNKMLIDLNINAVISLTHFLLPSMIKEKKGKIFNVSSMAAFMPGPYIAVYAASKAFVLNFSHSLASELEENNIQVSVLCPGDIKMEFQDNAGLSGYNVKSKLTLGELAQFVYDRFMIKGETQIIPPEAMNTIKMMTRSGINQIVGRNLYRMRKQMAKKIRR